MLADREHVDNSSVSPSSSYVALLEEYVALAKQHKGREPEIDGLDQLQTRLLRSLMALLPNVMSSEAEVTPLHNTRIGARCSQIGFTIGRGDTADDDYNSSGRRRRHARIGFLEDVADDNPSSSGTPHRVLPASDTNGRNERSLQSQSNESEVPEKVKVTINFPPKVWRAVEQMAREDGITRTEFLRRAISTEQFRRSVRDEGAQIIVQQPDGEKEKVRFPY